MTDTVPPATDIAGNMAQAMQFHRDYQRTCFINTMAGNLANGGWAAAQHQLPIMEEEWNELKRGIVLGDAAEVRDGASDLLFTLIGFCHRAGIDLLADYHAVVDSNYTKLDPSSQWADKTRDKYLALGIKTVCDVAEYDGTSHYITLTDGAQTDINGKFYPAGKWLKSVRFEDVDFSELPVTNLLTHPVGIDQDAFSVEECFTASSDDLPQVEDNDSYMEVPVEATKADEHEAMLRSLPAYCAVTTLREMLVNVGSVCQGMEEFLAHTAYRVLTGNAVSDVLASAMAVSGAQRFLTMLCLPLHYEAAVIPHRYALSRGTDGSHRHSTFQHVIDMVPPTNLHAFQRSIAVLSQALAADGGYLITWHANLMMAWKDSQVSDANARVIADTVMRELFELDADDVLAAHAPTPDDAAASDDTTAAAAAS